MTAKLVMVVLYGLFFTVALAWSFGKGAYQQITVPPAATAAATNGTASSTKYPS